MANQGTTLLNNLASRRASGSVVSLDGYWRAIVDPYEVGYKGITGDRDPRGWFRDFTPRHKGDRVEYDFDHSMPLRVPGDWNTQRPELFWYEGVVWYRKKFSVSRPESGRTFVHFGAANHTATVFLDGEELARHVGGFGPFSVELTGRLAPGEHSLIVMVDNTRSTDRIPGTRTDWFNFGGLHRSVELVRLPHAFIRSAWIAMQPDGGLVGEVSTRGESATDLVTVTIPEIDHRFTTAPNTRFRVAAEVAAGIERWRPGLPRFTDVEFSIAEDRVLEQIGFRTVETRGTDIVVNGEPVFLCGISLHAEGPSGGRRAGGHADAATLLQWAEELGANFVRLAHYQHDEAMVSEADRRGLLVWAELPVYWGIDWGDELVLQNALEQLDELIERDRNRGSVILWSVANETLPTSERTQFLHALVDRARDLDPTRLVTAALFSPPGAESGEVVVDDPLGELVDVIGINQYFGWYYGDRSELAGMQWLTAVERPVIFSELGAGAKAGLHGDRDDIWTEEFQAAVYEAQIAMVANQPICAGLSPWILKDFRTPLRALPGIQDGFNRKGLVSEEGQRKLAFSVLQEWYRGLAR